MGSGHGEVLRDYLSATPGILWRCATFARIQNREEGSANGHAPQETVGMGWPRNASEGWFMKLSSRSVLLRGLSRVIEPASRGFGIGGTTVEPRSRAPSQLESCAQARVPLGERRVALEGEGRARRNDRI